MDRQTKMTLLCRLASGLRTRFENGLPGMKMKIHEVVTKTDNDHHTLEFFENRGGKEVKTMQIDYTRKS